MAGQKGRRASVQRNTRETKIEAEIKLEGKGEAKVKTPYPFMDHMITAMVKHAGLDLAIKAEGDTEVDAHHTVEDLGLVIGQALDKALAGKKGIARFGWAWAPMDESLAFAALDISARPRLVYNVEIPKRKQWDFDCNLVKEFFQALADSARITLHMRLEYGDNYHHACEALFKAAGKALGQAAAKDKRASGVPSSKGALK